MAHTTAVILAAGLGTRMKSDLPKVLHRVLGRPMLFYAVDVALQAGVEDVVIVVGHGRACVEEAIGMAYPEMPTAFALQSEQRGTGHAVRCGLEAVPAGADEVLVLYGDVPNLRGADARQLVTQTRAAGAPVGLLTAVLDEPGGYGRIVRDAADRVVAIVEHKDADEAQLALREINVGTYLFEAAFLREAVELLTTDNAQAELYLTDLVARAAAAGRHATAVVVDDPATIHGINSRDGLARAESWARAKLNARWMREGVTFVDPERTYVDGTVWLDRDVTLGPGVMLQGATRVGRGTRIEAGCVIKGSLVGERVNLLAYSHLEGAELQDGATVGPFARLRPGAVIGESAKVGNFVEIKKTVLGRGSKASHLSYLGDATIGEGVNIGAGTITCNYDGRKKSPTILEDGVFIGSDSQLIAPVRIGKDAYVAAGTTVTKDVPAGALVVSRAPEKLVEGYTERKRAKWAAEAEKAKKGG